jgi:hypothetical protein
LFSFLFDGVFWFGTIVTERNSFFVFCFPKAETKKSTNLLAFLMWKISEKSEPGWKKTVKIL